MPMPAFVAVAPDASAELAVPCPGYLEDSAWRNTTFLAWAGVLGLAFVAACGWTATAGDGLVAPRMMLQQAYVPALLAVMAAILFRQGGMDLSMGAVVGLGATVFGALTSRELPIPVALAAALSVGLAIGLMHALAVGLLRLPGFLATIPTLAMAKGLAWFATADGQVIRAFPSIDDGVRTGAVAAGWALLAALLVGGVVLLQLRPLRPRVAGASPAASAVLRGLPYVASSMVAAVAGVLLVVRTGGATPNYGTGYEQDAIIAVLVGGSWLAGRRANVLGAFAAALLLWAVQLAGTYVGASPYAMLVWKGGIGLGGMLLGFLVHWGVATAYAARRPVPPPAPAASTASA